MKSVLELLEQSTALYPNKTAFIDEHNQITYENFILNAKIIASGIAERGRTNRPIAIFIEKSIECVTAMFAVLYSGNFYVVIDTEMPDDRIASICKTLNPVLTITNNNKKPFPEGICECVEFSDLLRTDLLCEEKLKAIRKKMIDTDPAYALFTSGSTGVPKGAIISHRSVLAYSQWVTETFDISEKTVFGNQTPLYFSMSVTDIYSTIQNAATLVLLPKSYFSFPAKLMEALKQNQVNTIYWVPSALGLVANWRALDFIKLEKISKVMFAGEIMPVKYLNYWKRHFPNALFANLFGPTEVTDICTYYIVNREFTDEQSLPIGNACNNCGIMIVKDDGTEALDGEEGELYVRGSFLSNGYYNNPEKTSEAFIQNPLNTSYPETVYRTGDIVKYNRYGELEYIGRRDFQIKHMGYRIELGEIETAVYAIEGISSVCCVYNQPDDEIIMVYCGQSVSIEEVSEIMKKRLPHYMYPSRIIKVSQMPHNPNGKIDRPYIRNNYQSLS